MLVFIAEAPVTELPIFPGYPEPYNQKLGDLPNGPMKETIIDRVNRQSMTIGGNCHIANRLRDLLAESAGPILEVGGPTIGGFRSFNLGPFSDRLIVSNILPELPITVSGPTGKEVRVGRYGKAEVIVDATNMHALGENSLGGIITSCLPSHTMDRFFPEAFRTLQRGSVLIWERGIGEFPQAMEAGFEIISFQSYTMSNQTAVWDATFRKPIS